MSIEGYGVLESNSCATIRTDTGVVVWRRAMTATEIEKASQPDMFADNGGEE